MKTIVVTGAAGGMGKAVCEKLKAEGCRVIGLDIRPVPEGIVCDVTDPDSVCRAAQTVREETGHLDGIVHTAGIYDLDSLTEIDEARFTRIFQINLFGVYRLNRELTPLMGPGSRITIITSELGPIKPLPFTGIYAVTKGALEKYAYSLRNELMLRGIFVTVVRPGAVQTGLLNMSTAALDRFVAHTQYYKPNAKRFYQIVNSVESKSVSPEKIGELVWKSQSAPHPRFVYNINRNGLLRLMGILPDHFQQWILRQILK